MFKVRYSDKVLVGETKEDWLAMPDEDIQILQVSMSIELDGKSRVLWYRDNPGLWGEFAFYCWDDDGDGRHPTAITPDRVLGKHRERTGRTDVTLADLSLDDYRAIGVKLGKSIPTPHFEQILQDAVNDPDIP
jgi:hypothetical protein